MIGTSRSYSSAAVLSSGQVLIAGGSDGLDNTPTASAELYNPSTGTFASTGNLGTPRYISAMVPLLDGRPLIMGGQDGNLVLSSGEIYTPVAQGLATSQTGLTFRAAAGSAVVPSQSVAVLSATATIPWTASTHTYQGGNWLSVTLAGGTSGPLVAPVILAIHVNPTGLAAQDYYGAVTLTPTDGTHPPLTVAIVLSIVPTGAAAPPGVTPGGLLFLETPGTAINPQSFTISNLTSSPIVFNGVSATTPSWFTFSSTSGTIPPGQSASITVTPSAAALAAGVYPGSIKIVFGDNSSQTVALLLVIPSTTSAALALAGRRRSAIVPQAPAGCAPTKLVPVFTTIGSGFNAPAAWPTPLVVQVVDDCGVVINTGSVTVSFSDGDVPVSLLSIGSGNWSGTWAPQHKTTGFTLRADAQQSPLTGSVQVSGQVLANPSVPVVSPGGIVSAGDFASTPALGLLVSIFGSGLADGVVPAPRCHWGSNSALPVFCCRAAFCRCCT